MNEMNKQFSFKDFTFNIKVKLNTKVEKRMNGKRWHEIVVNDMGFGQYYQTYEVEDAELIRKIINIQNELVLYVQEQSNAPLDERLAGLGFS